MSTSVNIQIKVNKKTYLKYFLISLLLLLLSALIFFKEGETNQSLLFTQIIGLMSCMFFGGILIFSTINLLDKRAGLVINNQGLRDNRQLISRLFRWENIIEISMVSKVIYITLDDFDQRLKEAGTLKKILMRWEQKRKFNAPYSIYDVEESLHKELVEEHKNEYIHRIIVDRLDITPNALLKKLNKSLTKNGKSIV